MHKNRVVLHLLTVFNSYTLVEKGGLVNGKMWCFTFCD